jgi:hypothetical protein
MTARNAMDREDSADRFDVLSVDEESALCLVRRIVDDIRGRGLEADIETVERAMIAAGASKLADAAESAAREYRLKNVKLSLDSLPQSGASIEVNFVAGKLCG